MRPFLYITRPFGFSGFNAPALAAAGQQELTTTEVSEEAKENIPTLSTDAQAPYDETTENKAEHG